MAIDRALARRYLEARELSARAEAELDRKEGPRTAWSIRTARALLDLGSALSQEPAETTAALRDAESAPVRDAWSRLKRSWVR